MRFAGAHSRTGAVHLLSQISASIPLIRADQ
jgi:hypothetical protein